MKVSIDQWLEEAKATVNAEDTGMFLMHNGVVRGTSKAQAREGVKDEKPLSGMLLGVDHDKVEKAVEEAKKMPGITYVRVWLNEGNLKVGDDIMFVLIGGNIRPNVLDAFQKLVGTLKNNCLSEKELF